MSVQKRAFIIHGWHGYPEEAWMPWMKTELEKAGYKVALPAMPHPTEPTIPEWMSFISNLVGEPDAETVMIGHSLGVQAVLRYLEIIGREGKSVKKTVLIAGSFPVGITDAELLEEEDEGDNKMRPWFVTPVDPKPVKKAAGKTTVFLSDTDPIINIEKAKASFQANLDPKIVIVPNKGHFNEDDGIEELPEVLEVVLENE